MYLISSKTTSFRSTVSILYIPSILFRVCLQKYLGKQQSIPSYEKDIFLNWHSIYDANSLHCQMALFMIGYWFYICICVI